VLGGAFNPVHTQHIALMRLVKEVVETEHNYAVSAGYLAVAPDGYVREKLKDQAMKAGHRLAMCNLAMQEQDWLVPCDRTYGSAPECGLRRRQHAGMHVLVVLGADRAMGKPERAKWRPPPRKGWSRSASAGPERANGFKSITAPTSERTWSRTPGPFSSSRGRWGP
jgi:hypothetical protein